MNIREEIEAALRRAVASRFPEHGDVAFDVSKPRDKAFGDFATNAAIVLGKAVGRGPMSVAAELIEAVGAPTDLIASVEAKKPGFVNIRASSAVLLRKLGEIASHPDPETYGFSDVGKGKLVQVEFVSANPTGPLNVVSARAAAVGDSLVRLLRRTGYDARSEFYVNDAGTQTELLGRSLEARFRGLVGERAEIPEGGYPGDYVIAIAEEVRRLAGWAARQIEFDRGLRELGVGEEGALVAEFLRTEGPAREAQAGSESGLHPTADTGSPTEKAAEDVPRRYLAHYLDFKRTLEEGHTRVWAALYVCALSSERMTADELAAHLVWVERYRSYLRSKCGRSCAGTDGEPVSAERIFLGEAVSGRRFDFRRFAVERIVEGQRASLERFGSRPEGGLRFDAWVRESSLEPVIEEVSAALFSAKTHTREKEGAFWLKVAGEAEDAGEDEWVLRRRTGQPTYFLSDIAYHVDKRRRGFERVIDIWGPDHHAHVARMKKAMLVMADVMPGLGTGEDWLDILIAQQVNLVREGKRIQMSKRAGEYVTLDDVISEVGADAARFFFLMRRSNSHLDFDLDLAKKTSEENPVYYVQYAHARIFSLIEFARQSGFADVPPGEADLGLLARAEEMDLIKGLADFEDTVRAAAVALEPHRIVSYVLDIAARFHRFYHNHRVVAEDRALTLARLCLVSAVRTVLRSGLSLIGVSAPASM